MNDPAPNPSTTVEGGRPSGWAFLRRPLQRSEGGLILATIAVIFITGLLDPQHNYLSDPQTSAKEILLQVALLGIFSLGAAIVIIAGGIDLSCGSVIAFSGTICATLMLLLSPSSGSRSTAEVADVGMLNMALAIWGTLVVGFLIGTFHAWLITVIRLPPFIATLSTLVGLRSLARIIVETVAKKTQIELSSGNPILMLTEGIWIPLGLFVLLSVLCWLLMSRTVLGRHLHALGGNEQAAKLSGIHTDRLKWVAYCLSALLSSIAGILYASQISVAAPQTLGRGYELNAIAAAVVGGCSLAGGVGTIPGTVLGVIFLRVVIDGIPKVIKANADVYEGLIVGIVIVIAVALTQLRQGGWRRQRFFSGALGVTTLLTGFLFLESLVIVFLEMDTDTRAAITRVTLWALLALAVLATAGVVVWRGRRGVATRERTKEGMG